MTKLDEPATPRQVGALHHQFERLGYRPADRHARLATCAAMLGLDGLDTTKDLSKGQAGQLAARLAGITGRGHLAAVPGVRLPPDGPEARARAMLARWDPAASRQRILTRLLTRYIAAEMAARIQEAARDARKTPVQEPAA